MKIALAFIAFCLSVLRANLFEALLVGTGRFQNLIPSLDTRMSRHTLQKISCEHHFLLSHHVRWRHIDARVTSYSLRHSAARWMRRHRVSEWDVQTQLGHKRPGTTETYTAFHRDYLNDAANALDELVRTVCVPLPHREVRMFRRNAKESQRDGWWAV